jgi:hypothetical protein
MGRDFLTRRNIMAANTDKSTETTTEAEAPAVEAAPPAKYYKVKNLSMYSLAFEKGSIKPGEEGIASLSEVCTYVGQVEELGVAE